MVHKESGVFYSDKYHRCICLSFFMCIIALLLVVAPNGSFASPEWKVVLNKVGIVILGISCVVGFGASFFTSHDITRVKKEAPVATTKSPTAAQ